MTYKITLFFCCLSTMFYSISHCQNIKFYKNKEIYIVYAFENDNKFFICAAINAYVDGKIFAINPWLQYDNFKYINDTNELINKNFSDTNKLKNKYCVDLYKIYKKFYNEKYEYKIPSPYFKPIWDSTELNYGLFIDSDEILISNDTILNAPIYKNDNLEVIYIAYKAKGQFFTVYDVYKGVDCVSYPQPVSSFWFQSEQEPILPWVTFVKIDSYAKLNKIELKKFGLKKTKKRTFKFVYRGG